MWLDTAAGKLLHLIKRNAAGPSAGADRGIRATMELGPSRQRIQQGTQ